MKLFSSRAIDTSDLRSIWPRCSFKTVEVAVGAYYEAYPTEEPDKYLPDHLRRIL